MKKVITINRQFSSGGREVAKRLADTLNLAYYDKELIAKISEQTNLAPSYIEQYSESATSRSFSFTFCRTLSRPTPELSPNDKIQIAQTKIIKELATTGNCVIVGRCANYALADEAFKVFIYSSDMDARVKRCFEKVEEDKEKTEQEMKKQIISIDKQRAKYHSYYTGQDWSDINNYNLCIDTAKISIKKAVELIARALED